MGEIGICTATLLTDPMGATPDQVREAAEAAVEAGFTEASVWAFQLAGIEGVDLHVTALEAALAWAAGTDAEADAEADQLCALASDLGSSKLLAVTLDPALPDVDVARQRLGRLVARAEEVGAQVCVEFLPWSGIPDLASAWKLVEPLGPGAGIVIDTWHWVRQPGGPNLDLLATIPGDRIGYVQACDVAPIPQGDAMTEAMSARLLPGEGVVDFGALVSVLRDIGAEPFVATEIFNPGIVAANGALGAAKAMREAASSVLT